MKFSFQESNPEIVKDKIMEALGGRELGKMVAFSLSGDQMIVTISKLGTSTLSFDHASTSDGLEFNLAKEKIAFAHRAFKDDVTNKLKKIITQVGGNIHEG